MGWDGGWTPLTRRLLRRGQFASRDDLAAAIGTFVLAYDEHDAKPYRWTPARSRMNPRRIKAAPH